MAKLRVLIVPDKFKGTLSAGEAAEAIARGWRRVRPQDKLELLPMSDGGDGFGQVLGGLLSAGTRKVRTLDAAHQPCVSRFWWESASRMVVIESAAVIGLAMLPPRKFHPFELDTFGLGQVIVSAQRAGARSCILGIGGSATNDGGFGVARALGWNFLNRKGRPIERWTELWDLDRISPPQTRRSFARMIVAVDVQNPLLGARGASRVYGPQKGLRKEDFPLAEKCLGRLARVVQRELGLDLAQVAGSGAAGGLGFGLQAFLGAKVQPGFELFARMARLDARLRRADCVITAEGAIDRSTLMGKGVGQVLARCTALGTPCLGLAGSLDASPAALKPFAGVGALTQLTSLENARSNAAFWLRELAGNFAAALSGHAAGGIVLRQDLLECGRTRA